MRLDGLYRELEQQHSLPVGWLSAIEGAESSGDTAVSPKGARGRFQFMPATAQRFGLDDPNDPVQSAHAAAKYSRVLADMFDNNPVLMFAGYNAGEGAVQRHKGVPPYRETQSYVQRGMGLLRNIAESIIPAAEAGESAVAEDPMDAVDRRYSGGGVQSAAPETEDPMDAVDRKYAAQAQKTAEFDVPPDFSSSTPRPTSSKGRAVDVQTGPSAAGAFGRGFVDRLKRMGTAAQQAYAQGGIVGPEDPNPLPSGAAEQYEQQVIQPRLQQIEQEAAPYREDHPGYYGFGEIGADVATSLPLLAVGQPELALHQGGTALAGSLGRRFLADAVMGAGQGALTGALTPVDTSKGGDYGEQKRNMMADAVGTGALLAPAVDAAILGGAGMYGGVRKGLAHGFNWLTANRSPLSKDALEAATSFDMIDDLTAYDRTGNRVLLNLETGNRYAFGGGSIEQGYQRKAEKAMTGARSMQTGIPIEASGQRVAQEIMGNRAVRANQQESAVKRFANQFDTGATPDEGVQSGLQRQLQANKGKIQEKADEVERILDANYLRGSAIPMRNTAPEIARLYNMVSPETWQKLPSSVQRNLRIIADGLTDTQSLARMPMDNLVEVADNAYRRAVKLYPDHTPPMPKTAGRRELAAYVQQLNGMISKSPASVLGSRPAGVQGIQYTIKSLGGIKSDYMADVIGESKRPPNLMPDLFRKSGESPDEMARKLGELGYPGMDDTPDGVEKMYSAIRDEIAGKGKAVSFDNLERVKAQEIYDEQMQRALSGKAAMPDEFLPGMALDFAGVRKLDRQLGELSRAARSSSGGIGSEAEMVYTAARQALAKDLGQWADDTGVPEIVDAVRALKNEHIAGKVPYTKARPGGGGVPGVNETVYGGTSDGAYGRLFNPDRPDRAAQAFPLLDAGGQQSAKYGTIANILKAATKDGEFNPQAFLAAARQQQPLMQKIFSPAELKSFGDLADRIGRTQVNPGMEAAAQRALTGEDTSAFMTFFASSKAADAKVDALMRKLSPDGRRAVADWVIDSAYRASADEVGHTFSLAKYATFLKQHETALRAADRWDGIKGVVELFTRVQRVGESMSPVTPATGVRAAMAGGQAIYTILGGISPATPVIGYGAAKLLSLALTTKPGYEMLAWIGRNSVKGVDKAILDPVWQKSFATQIARVAAVAGATGSATTQTGSQ